MTDYLTPDRRAEIESYLGRTLENDEIDTVRSLDALTARHMAVVNTLAGRNRGDGIAIEKRLVDQDRSNARWRADLAASYRALADVHTRRHDARLAAEARADAARYER